MTKVGSIWLVALACSSTVISQKCKLQFDARVPTGTKATAFDAKGGLFDPQNVIGAGLKFSQILQLPAVAPSLFDVKSVPVEVTISDKSIFNKQTGFRRAELLPASVSGKDPSTEGIKTIHFSVQQDAVKKLNTSHEYQLAFMEDNAFSTNQWVLKTGTILGQKQNPNDLVLFGNVKTSKVLFKTPFTAKVFHNFALTMDFKANQMTVFYSQGTDPLKNVADKVANDLAGRGQFHFGALKKGLGDKGDITKVGVQPSGIDEGMIFGGIFEEDTADGCFSLAP